MATEKNSKKDLQDQDQNAKNDVQDQGTEDTGTKNEETKLGLAGKVGQRLLDADKKRADKKLKKQEAKATKKQAKAEKNGMSLAGKIGVAAAVVGAALGGAAVYIANKDDDQTVQLMDGEITMEPAAIPERTMENPVPAEPAMEAAS